MSMNNLYNRVRIAMESLEDMAQNHTKDKMLSLQIKGTHRILKQVYDELTPGGERHNVPTNINPTLNGENKLPVRDMKAVWEKHNKHDPLMNGVTIVFKPLKKESNND